MRIDVSRQSVRFSQQIAFEPIKTVNSKSKSFAVLAGRLHRPSTAGFTRSGGSTSGLLGTVAIAFCVLIAGQAKAVTRTWTGTTSTDWGVATNWSGSTVPVALDSITFTGIPTTQPTNNTLGTIRLIYLNLTNDLGDATRTVTLDGNAIRLDGSVLVSAITSGTTSVTNVINNNIQIVTNDLSFSMASSGTVTHNVIVNGIISDVSGDYALTKGGAGDTGVLTLTNSANTYDGGTSVESGILAFTSVADAGFVSALGDGTAVSTISPGSVGVEGTLRYIGTDVLGHSSNRVIDLAGTTGGATIEANGTGPLVFSGTNTATGLGPKTLTLSGTNTLDNSIGAIVDSTGFTTALTKLGVGKWILSGANTYTGTTTVSTGTLAVNGSLGDTAVTVAGAATLGGSGTVGTSTVLNTLTVNGTLAPGNSTGILTVNDNLDLNGSLSAELNGTTAGTGHDRVVVNGAVDITGSSLTASFETFTPAAGNILFIVVNDGTDAISGTFTGKAQDAIVANYRGFDWKISYSADSAGGTFTGGNDIALTTVPPLSSWKFNSSATLDAHLGSSGTATGLTVSRLNFHPTFDAAGFVNNEQTTLNDFSTHDRWAADNTLPALRMRRADYLHGAAPSGRSATFNSTNTSISSAADTLGTPIWFSVSTDALTNATIHAIGIKNPGASNATTYYFSKSGDPRGTGVSVSDQETIFVSAPITLASSETVFFSINMDSDVVGTNHNIGEINLLGTTVALPPPPPPIGLVTGTLTVAPPHGTHNRLSVTLDPGPLGSSSNTTNLTGTINATVNIDPATGKTPMLTLSGRVNGTGMSFVKTVPFVPLLSYNIQASNLGAAINTIAPPGTVNPDTGVFAANQHNFILDQGTFSGTAAGNSITPPYTLSSTRTLAGIGTGNGSLTLTPAGTSGAYRLFNAVVILPLAVNQTIDVSGVATVITGSGTIKATGQIQMPSSEFNAWMIAQSATSFDPKADTAGNGAPDGIKWALGLSSLYDNPLPFLLKPHPTIPGTFTITLPSGGTVAPLTVESSTNLLPPWTAVPAGQLTPNGNPIPIDSTGTIRITPDPASKLFLRMRANP